MGSAEDPMIPAMVKSQAAPSELQAANIQPWQQLSELLCANDFQEA